MTYMYDNEYIDYLKSKQGRLAEMKAGQAAPTAPAAPAAPAAATPPSSTGLDFGGGYEWYKEPEVPTGRTKIQEAPGGVLPEGMFSGALKWAADRENDLYNLSQWFIPTEKIADTLNEELVYGTMGKLKGKTYELPSGEVVGKGEPYALGRLAGAAGLTALSSVGAGGAGEAIAAKAVPGLRSAIASGAEKFGNWLVGGLRKPGIIPKAAVGVRMGGLGAGSASLAEGGSAEDVGISTIAGAASGGLGVPLMSGVANLSAGIGKSAIKSFAPKGSGLYKWATKPTEEVAKKSMVEQNALFRDLLDVGEKDFIGKDETVNAAGAFLQKYVDRISKGVPKIGEAATLPREQINGMMEEAYKIGDDFAKKSQAALDASEKAGSRRTANEILKSVEENLSGSMKEVGATGEQREAIAVVMDKLRKDLAVEVAKKISPTAKSLQNAGLDDVLVKKITTESAGGKPSQTLIRLVEEDTRLASAMMNNYGSKGALNAKQVHAIKRDLFKQVRESASTGAPQTKESNPTVWEQKNSVAIFLENMEDDMIEQGGFQGYKEMMHEWKGAIGLQGILQNRMNTESTGAFASAGMSAARRALRQYELTRGGGGFVYEAAKALSGVPIVGRGVSAIMDSVLSTRINNYAGALESIQSHKAMMESMSPEEIEIAKKTIITNLKENKVPAPIISAIATQISGWVSNE